MGELQSVGPGGPAGRPDRIGAIAEAGGGGLVLDGDRQQPIACDRRKSTSGSADAPGPTRGQRAIGRGIWRRHAAAFAGFDLRIGGPGHSVDGVAVAPSAPSVTVGSEIPVTRLVPVAQAVTLGLMYGNDFSAPTTQRRPGGLLGRGRGGRGGSCGRPPAAAGAADRARTRTCRPTSPR